MSAGNGVNSATSSAPLLASPASNGVWCGSNYSFFSRSPTRSL